MGEKMWAVFSLLMNSEECISAEDIQRQLEEKGYDIGLKAVYAVIKQINVFTSLMFGKEIIKAVRRFGYMIETGYFDEAQIQLLIDMVNYRQDLTNNDKREIVNKLLKLSPAKQKDYLIVPELEDDDEGVYSLSKNLKIITSAIRNKKDIRFQYVDYSIRDGHPVETYSTKGNAGINHEYYNVSPYNTVIVDGHYYLRAYYNKHKDSLTTFRIDRIRKLDKSRTYYFDFDDDEGVYSLSKNLKIITSAIRNKKDIRFQYVDYSIRDGHPVETYSTKGNAGINHEYYNVSPYNTVIVDGHYYLRAYYNKHKDSLTTFRIDRIRKLDKSRTYYFDFDDEEKMSESLKQSLAKSMNSFFDGDEITLHIQFDGVLIREVVSRLGKDITINKTIAPIENDHQWYETRVEGIIFNTGLMNWIRQFGPMIIVVGPEKLKEAITDGLEENLSYYKK